MAGSTGRGSWPVPGWTARRRSIVRGRARHRRGANIRDYASEQLLRGRLPDNPARVGAENRAQLVPTHGERRRERGRRLRSRVEEGFSTGRAAGHLVRFLGDNASDETATPQSSRAGITRSLTRTDEPSVVLPPAIGADGPQLAYANGWGTSGTACPMPAMWESRRDSCRSRRSTSSCVQPAATRQGLAPGPPPPPIQHGFRT